MGGAGFWRNFNVFVGGFLLASGMGAFLVYIPLAAVARLVLPPGRAEMVALPATYVAIAAALAWIWRKRGLSPVQRLPERESRFKAGHALLLAFNGCVLAGMALPLVAPALLPALSVPGLAPAVMVLPMLLTLAGIAGLLMVLTARTPPPSLTEAPDFADTVVERPSGAQTPPVRRPQPARPAAVARTSRGAWLGIALGVAASGLVVYVALVFAATGFQGRAQQFAGVAVPVAAGLFLVYLGGALWLGSHRRARAAMGVAWAPVLLVMVGLPLLQGMWLVLASAFGR